VHLKVGDAELAKRFYVDQLGFELTAQWHGAVFVAAGGYHHHMAMNTWNSAGVGLRAPALGLGRVDITLPTDGDVAQAAARLRALGHQVRDTGALVELDDPWGNLVRLSS
jgi:catechol 2,3-dioxygenase